MIPADLASRLRFVSQDLPAAPQAIPAIRQLTDVLSDLHVGQRILAEVQALLPNGTYRAVVAQREITLALPFSAKAGDSLELEVIDTDGKLTLAFVTNRSTQAEQAANPAPSVATTLSKTGNLIGDLLSEIDQPGGQAKPAVLNANQPIVNAFPASASELVPLLKEALHNSGMFYEAHQARWVQGQLPTQQLLQEPQGQHSSLIPLPQADLTPLGGLTPETAENAPASASAMVETTDDEQVHLSAASRQKSQEESAPATASATTAARESANATARENAAAPPAWPSGSENATLSRSTVIHPELTPLVQQQLHALAAQHFVWQGQIWPGQTMDWEILPDDARTPRSPDGNEPGWRTRLKLDLPHLGGIDAQLTMTRSGQMQIALTTTRESSQSTLQTAGSSLALAFNQAGLSLQALTIQHGEIPG